MDSLNSIDLDSIPDLVKKGDMSGVAKLGMSAAEKARKDAEKADEAKAKALETGISEREELTKKAKEPGGALAPLDLKEYKPDPPTDPWAVWGSPAMWLAGMSGLMGGRRSLTNAMTAASSYMQAVQKNDQAAAKQKFEQWKQETENAIKAHEWQQKAYEDALKGVSENSKDRQAIALTIAHATGDEITAKSIEEYGMKPTEEMWKQRQENARA